MAEYQPAIASGRQESQRERSPGSGDCWNRIGVGGDRSCPELPPLIHCRNCPVYGAAARSFFNRPAPEGYLAEWARWITYSDCQGASEPDEQREESGVFQSHGVGQSVLIFRLGAECLAFRTHTLREVAKLRPVHCIPHRSNEILLGVVNLRGQLELCVSLHGLLGALATAVPTRLVVIHDSTCHETWAFPADEVLGVERIARGHWHSVPSTLVNPAVGFSQAVLSWSGRSVGLLDEQRVFAALRRFGR